MDIKKEQTYFILKNPIQRYAWGSKQWIQDLLSLPESERQLPMAELWMGAHPRSPSIALLDHKEEPLDRLIHENPSGFLGEATAEQFATLPYLFKILAAETPLSIQAHPDKKQAEIGFAREEAAGIPLTAENRNYKDPNHKPEIICALSTFTAMCGFREQTEIAQLLSLLNLTELQQSLEAIQETDTKGAYQAFLRSLFSLSQESRLNLTKNLQARLPKLEQKYPTYAVEWGLIKRFCALYPGDSAVISPLYLNVLSLHPGEALFLPAGILHAYLHGFGVELMANSDNVLRGGLTPKYIDVDELLRILRFEPFKPEILSPIETDEGMSTYPSPVQEFALFRIDLTKDVPRELSPGKPTILILLEGTAYIGTGQQNRELQKGMSLFLPAERAPLTLTGSARIFGATIGSGIA